MWYDPRNVGSPNFGGFILKIEERSVEDLFQMQKEIDAKKRCKGADRGLFFETFEKGNKDFKIKVIKEYCEQCPVRMKCLQMGKATKSYGLWGGIYLENGRPTRNTLAKSYLEDKRDFQASLDLNKQLA